MRMRKLPWAEDYIKEAEVVEHTPQERKGKWKELLHCDRLHVEIGSGKGDYWILMSQQYPEEGWIGIEKDVNVAAIAVRKYKQLPKQLPNVSFIQEDAEAIETWFAPGEIDVLHLNFSDPWPKKRAHKKRLSHASFIERYQQILNEQGEIIMKTDNGDLFEFSLLQFQEAGYYLHEISVDYRKVPHEEDAITEYEQRFLSLGQPIYRAVWKKVAYVNTDKKKR